MCLKKQTLCYVLRNKNYFMNLQYMYIQKEIEFVCVFFLVWNWSFKILKCKPITIKDR